MKISWFGRAGIVYFPVSIPGYIIAIAAIFYLIFAFIDIDSRSHSVSDTLINFVFRLIIVFLIYNLIAFFTTVLKQGK